MLTVPATSVFFSTYNYNQHLFIFHSLPSHYIYMTSSLFSMRSFQRPKHITWEIFPFTSLYQHLTFFQYCMWHTTNKEISQFHFYNPSTLSQINMVFKYFPRGMNLILCYLWCPNNTFISPRSQSQKTKSAKEGKNAKKEKMPLKN